MAGGAARPSILDPDIRKYLEAENNYTESLLGHTAPLAEKAGRGNARADQGRQFQRALAGRSVRLFAEISRGRAARNVRPHAARRRRGQDRARRRRAGREPRIFQVRRRAAFAGSQTAGVERRYQGLGIFFDPRARLGRPARIATTSSRRPTAASSGARIATASSTSSSTTTIARCRCGGIDSAPNRPTTRWSMRSRIPAGSPICTRAPRPLLRDRRRRSRDLGATADRPRTIPKRRRGWSRRARKACSIRSPTAATSCSFSPMPMMRSTSRSSPRRSPRPNAPTGAT